MFKDLISNLKDAIALIPIVFTVDVNGPGIDRQGFNGNIMLAANVGASGDTLSGSVMIELEVEESDDDSTYTDVADADLSDSVTGTNNGTFAVIDDPAEDSQIYKTEYRGSKRYVRVVANMTGTHTNGTPMSAQALIGLPQRAAID